MVGIKLNSDPLVEVNDNLKINPTRVDFVTIDNSNGSSTYTVAVNSRLFSLTQEEYDKLFTSNAVE